MKIALWLAAILALGAGTQTFANGRGHWERVEDEALVAETPEQVRDFFVQYAQELSFFHTEATASLLSGKPVRQVTKLTLRRQKDQWLGETICGQDDPRLKREFVVLESYCQQGRSACVRIGRKSRQTDPCQLGN